MANERRPALAIVREPPDRDAASVRTKASDRVPRRADHRAERAILAAAFIADGAFARAECVVKQEDFEDSKNAEIFGAMSALFARGSAIEPVALAHELRHRERLNTIGGVAYLSEVMDATSTAAYVEDHARIVADLAFTRRVADAARLVEAKACDPATRIEALVEFGSSKIFEAMERRTTSDLTRAGDAVYSTLDDWAKRAETNTAPGLKTGLRALDDMLAGGGLRPGRTYLFAGQPGAGKTGLVTGIATTVAGTGAPVAFFSLEMPREELAVRLMCRDALVDTRRFESQRVSQDEFDRVTAAGAAIYRLPLMIDDSGDQTVMDVRAKARKMKLQHGLALIVIDYVQLMRAPGIAEREREVAFVSRGLKSIAKSLAVPVVAISSLNRTGSKRANNDRRPQLGDLRDSGALEFDSDFVGAVYRDELVNRNSQDKGVAEVIILKQRGGPTGTVRLKYTATCVRFDDLDVDEPPAHVEDAPAAFDDAGLESPAERATRSPYGPGNKQMEFAGREHEDA